MILKKVRVENFRLLKDFELDLKDELSLIVGKNNCGKTSIFIILEKMLNSSKVTWEDINLEKQKEVFNYICKFNINSQCEKNFLEVMKLQLYIEYDDKDSYRNIQKFIMDLNPKNNIILLEFVLIIDVKNIEILKKIIEEKYKIEEKDEIFKSFSKYISKNFSNFYKIKKYSRRYDVENKQVTSEKSEEIDNKDIKKVITFNGIYDYRLVSNKDSNSILSKLTQEYYNFYKNKEKNSQVVFDNLERELENADKSLNKIYNGKESENEVGIFTNLVNVIKKYGGKDSGVDISIESLISDINLVSDNTKFCYKQEDSSLLPENYNGLGYLNLIGMLFEIETKLQSLYEQTTDLNIIYIEEPEVHTHPQLQYIFIRNIKEHIAKHREELIKKNRNLQLIITSHSSHIVSQCDFDDIIYFKKTENSVKAKSFKSLENKYNGDEIKAFQFVKQYLTLNRSELFFVDKVICIEGDTERILMPAMMKKIDDFDSDSDSIPLLSQNISVIEVGAYSNIFMPLFEFLGIQVLIITDIDPVCKGSSKKCNPNKVQKDQDIVTSNNSIKKFFKSDSDDKDIKIYDLIEKKNTDKIKNNIMITYQIPDKGSNYISSSFEDDFINLNKEFVKKNKKGFIKHLALKNFEDVEIDNDSDIYEFAQCKVKKKPIFALSILYFDGENGEIWKVPRYIKEGLLWIR